MDKRGQLYLLAALIIGFIIFSVVTPSNIVHETVIEDNFKEIAGNFEVESAKFINHLITTDADISQNFLNFTIVFTSYAKTKDPDFGLLYAFIYKDRLYLGNYLHDMVTVNHGATVRGCFSEIKTGFTIAGLSISIPDINYQLLSSCQLNPPPVVTNPLIDLEIHEQGNTTVRLRIDLTKNNPDVVIIAKEKKDSIRKIYTKGKFV